MRGETRFTTNVALIVRAVVGACVACMRWVSVVCRVVAAEGSDIIIIILSQCSSRRRRQRRRCRNDCTIMLQRVVRQLRIMLCGAMVIFVNIVVVVVCRITISHAIPSLHNMWHDAMCEAAHTRINKRYAAAHLYDYMPINARCSLCNFLLIVVGARR